MSLLRLLDAIEMNHIVVVSELIASGTVSINCKPSPLHRAAMFGRIEIMQLLLNAGADIDATDETRSTACQAAINFNQFHALRLLIERGANVATIRPVQQALLFNVSHKIDDNMTLLLLDAGAPLDDLTDDIVINLVANPLSFAVLTRLLARNVDVANLRDSLGNSMFHRVIANARRGVNSEPILRALIADAGFRIDLDVDHTGATPLFYAAMRRHETALRVLVELGANVDQQQVADGWTALHDVCASYGDSAHSCVDLLLALGANVHLVSSDDRQTAAHFAALHQDQSALCALLAAGCNLDQLDAVGDTARQIALRSSCVLPSAKKIDAARKRIAKIRLDFVRHRAMEICIGLQPLGLDALQLCEAMMQSFGALGALIDFHQWWNIAITIKHFNK